MLVGITSCVLLFVGLLATLEAGRRLRRRGVAPGAVIESSPSDSGYAAVDAVVFAVLGLLIAFIFAASASRFDERRKLIVEQSNALGTAWLRVDLLHEADREPIRQRMRQWVKDSLEVMRAASDLEPAEFQRQLTGLQQLQTDAWAMAVAGAARAPDPRVANVLLLPPINDWIDLSSTRLAMNHRGPPPMSIPTLVTMALVGGLLVGFDMGRSPKRSVMHALVFAGVITFSVYVIVDLNHHRAGLIRIDSADESMIQLQRSMQAGTRPATLPAK